MLGKSGSGDWGFSTISGNARCGTGNLNNELYRGRLIWNRQRFFKDPATALRIVEDDLWQRVKDQTKEIEDV